MKSVVQVQILVCVVCVSLRANAVGKVTKPSALPHSSYGQIVEQTELSCLVKVTTLGEENSPEFKFFLKLDFVSRPLHDREVKEIYTMIITLYYRYFDFFFFGWG